MDKAAAQESKPTTAEPSAANSGIPAKPVRSAKDAINAMYAETGKKTLSNYLATSAKEIINASSSSGGKNSAASLHRGSAKRQIETSRPSASGVMRVAKAEPKHVPTDTTHAMDPLAQKTAPASAPRISLAPQPDTASPVIKTSLKLGPKKTPVVMRPRATSNAPTKPALNTPKSQTALAKLLANRRAARSQAPAATSKPHATMSGDIIGGTPKAPATPDPKTAETLRIMRQAVKQTTGQSVEEAPKTVPRPKMRRPRGLMQDVIRPSTNSTSPKGRTNLPSDSVKRRFRTAPKDYTACPEVQDSAYLSQNQPDTSADKPPVEIYGLMDEEPTGKRPEMPVIEDYHPDGKPTADSKNESPNNNKYAIKGQSPLFLKSVNVEKRPLSGSIGSKDSADGTLYQRPDSTPISDKNVYNKKEAKKSLPTKPTVIIPASRRSRAPMIFLLILTVILGAAVGAFVYLCFFQYME